MILAAAVMYCAVTQGPFAAAGGGKSPVDLGASAYWNLADVRHHALGIGHRWWSMSPFAAGDEPHTYEAGSVHSRTVKVTTTESFRGDTEAATRHIAAKQADGWRGSR